MTTRAQIEAMEKKQAQLAQALSQAKKRLNGEARVADTRKKILIGAGMLKAMETDNDLKLQAMPAIHYSLSEHDSVTLKALMGEEK